MITYYKLVRNATKIKMVPPKQKDVDLILVGTSDQYKFMEIMRALKERIGDTAWVVVYKSLIITHMMIREGEKNVTIKYLSRHLEFFNSDVLLNSNTLSSYLQPVKRYLFYLKVRCQEYNEIGLDYVQEGSSNLKNIKMTSSKKWLSHVKSLEAQISALIKNRYSQYDLNNDLLMHAFKLFIQDLLILYNVLNEGIITLLESFFELEHKDAVLTLDLYKRFVELTENVVKYLKSGKSVGLKIPVIKHITTKLIKSLEEHLREDNVKVVSNKTTAQLELEKVRQERILLEQQLQQITLSSKLPQQATYNPFSEFTFERPMSSQIQSTSTSFAPFQVPINAGIRQNVLTNSQTINNDIINVPLQQNSSTGLDHSHVQTQNLMHQHRTSNSTFPLQNQQTGFYSSNTQIVPTFTGAGFGGYTLDVNPITTQYQQSAVSVQNQLSTGSNNPFSLENVAKKAQKQELTNPFSKTNSQNPPTSQNPLQVQPSHNPFNTQHSAFSGLKQLPTVDVFPQTQMNLPIQQSNQQVHQQFMPVPQYPLVTSQYRPNTVPEGGNLIDI